VKGSLDAGHSCHKLREAAEAFLRACLGLIQGALRCTVLAVWPLLIATLRLGAAAATFAVKALAHGKVVEATATSPSVRVHAIASSTERVWCHIVCVAKRDEIEIQNFCQSVSVRQCPQRAKNKALGVGAARLAVKPDNYFGDSGTGCRLAQGKSHGKKPHVLA